MLGGITTGKTNAVWVWVVLHKSVRNYILDPGSEIELLFFFVYKWNFIIISLFKLSSIVSLNIIYVMYDPIAKQKKKHLLGIKEAKIKTISIDHIFILLPVNRIISPIHLYSHHSLFLNTYVLHTDTQNAINFSIITKNNYSKNLIMRLILWIINAS